MQVQGMCIFFGGGGGDKVRFHPYLIRIYCPIGQKWTFQLPTSFWFMIPTHLILSRSRVALNMRYFPSWKWDDRKHHWLSYCRAWVAQKPTGKFYDNWCFPVKSWYMRLGELAILVGNEKPFGSLHSALVVDTYPHVMFGCLCSPFYVVLGPQNCRTSFLSGYLKSHYSHFRDL